MTKERIVCIDIARSLCMVWIVAFWHMCPYLGINNNNIWNATVTHVSLAAFTFFSGLFLGKKQEGTKSFYYGRFIRIYPMFFIICIIVYIGHGGINTLSHLFCSLTGLSIFMPPHTPTLWYVDMLIILYAITPILLTQKFTLFGGGILDVVLKALMLFSLLYVMQFYVHLEVSILQYLPFYIIGILTPIKAIKLSSNKALKCITFSLLAVAVLMMLIVKFELPKGLFIHELINGFGVVSLIIVSNIIEKLSNDNVLSLFKKLAYASFMAYLLHRTLYKVFKVIFASNDGNIPVYIAPMMVAFLFVFSFFAQYYYDKTIKYLHLV